MKTRILLFLLVSMAVLLPLKAQRQMENLGRGTVAVKNGSSTFVSWRIKAEEFNNGTTYNLYRDNSLVVSNLEVSNYSDTYSSDSKYSVAAVVNGVEQQQSPQVAVNSSQVITVPLNNIGAYHIPMTWTGDLDGDGEFEFVVVRMPNYDMPDETIKFEAYDVDGTRLWQIDMGPLSINRNNIEGGAAVLCNGMWDGATVYDMDMDGKSEVILKTANGTVLGDGTTVTYSNNTQNFISVLNGQTGAEISRAALPSTFLSDGPLQVQLGIAYLDGIKPSIIAKAKNRQDNGWFNRLVAAYSYSSGTIANEWVWYDPGNCPEFHQLRMVDVDLDGKDEVCDGGTVIDEDGSLLYTLGTQGVVHGDRFHIGDLDPDRPGLEGYGIQQDNASGLAWYYYDAKTGELLQTQYRSFIGDYARGNVADIDPNHPGFEMWTFTDGIYNVQDGKITNNITDSYPNFRLWWDGDVQSEMLDDYKFNDWNYVDNYEVRILNARDFGGTTVTRAAPALYGDIIGDWREEVVYARNDHNALLIFTTINSTSERIYTLLQNPEYRLCLTTKGYYQSNQIDYFLGYDMSTPPTPAVINTKAVWNGSVSQNWNNTEGNWSVYGASGNYTSNDSVLFGIIDESLTSVVINEIIEPAITYVMSPVDYTFSGSGELSGTGDLVKSGYSTLTMRVNSSYTGKTRIEQGTMVIDSALSNSDVTVLGGAVLAGSGNISGNCTFENRSNIAPGTKSETGTLTLAQSLLLNNGIICEFDITDDSTNLVKPSDKITVGGDLTIEDGVTFKVNAFDEEIKPGYYPLVSYSGSITGDINSIEIEGLFGRKYLLMDTLNSITLKILGTRKAGIITWEGSSNAWDLLTTSNWLQAGSSSSFVSGDSVVFDETGVAKSAVILDGELPIGQMTINGDNVNYSFTGDGVIGGEGDLIKNDNGVVQLLSPSNAYTGKTVVNGGTLVVNKLDIAGAPSSIGANPNKSYSQFVINNARFKYNSSSDSYTDKGITLGGQSDTLDISILSATLSVNARLLGSGKLVKTGEGTLYLLDNNNSYTGGTVIEAGEIELNDPGNYATIGALGSGSVKFKGGTLTLGNTTSGTECPMNFIVPEGQTGTLNSDARCNLSGSLTGSGTFNVYNPGTIDRTTYNGNWSAFSGTINASGNAFRIRNSLGFANATVNLNSGVTMYYDSGSASSSTSAQSVRIGSLSGVSGSYLKDENWIIGENNDSTTFKGVISGRSVTKRGSGTLVLASGNTYTGGTNVNEGKLLVTNQSGSATGTGTVYVNDGGILGGNGIISGTVNVKSGGTLYAGFPNNYSGSSIKAKYVIMNSGSTYYAKINTKYSLSDKAEVTLSFAANGQLVLNNLSTYPYKVGQSFQVVSAASIIGSFTSISPAAPGDGLAWDTSSFAEDGTIRVVASSGIDDENYGQITLYPNPINDKLYINHSTSSQINKILVKDMAGQIVISKTSSDLNVIDFSQIQSGIYVLEIKLDDLTISKKIVKK